MANCDAKNLRDRLSALNETVRIILIQQEHNPGYAKDILESVVNSELKRLVAEQARFEAQEARK